MQILVQNKQCLVNVSQHRFTEIITALTEVWKTVEQTKETAEKLPSGENNYRTSIIIIMETLEACLARAVSRAHNVLIMWFYKIFPLSQSMSSELDDSRMPQGPRPRLKMLIFAPATHCSMSLFRPTNQFSTTHVVHCCQCVSQSVKFFICDFVIGPVSDLRSLSEQYGYQMYLTLLYQHEKSTVSAKPF